jgi:hypothetical protein
LLKSSLTRTQTGNTLSCLKHPRVDDFDDCALLVVKFEGIYDWMAMHQAALEKARRAVPTEGQVRPVKRMGALPSPLLT